MIDGGGNNVYHLLFYMISNFLIADTEKQIHYYYPFKGCKLEDEMLALLPSNFIRCNTKIPGEHYASFMNAIPIFEDTALPESYFLLRKLFAPHIHPCMKKKIYVRRSQKSLKEVKRTFLNEDEVSYCMKICGFDIIEMEDYSVKDQMKLFSEADTIVSAHGAALSFTLFCHPGTKVIEIFKATTKQKRHYQHIAQVLGLDFTRFSDVSVVDNDENMIVNTHALYDLLKV